MARKSWQAIARGGSRSRQIKSSWHGFIGKRSLVITSAALLLAVVTISCGGTDSPCSVHSYSGSPENDAIWLSGGGDLHNTRSQNSEALLNSANIGDLAPKWVQTVAGDVSATPTTDGKTVYFPDWVGNLYALTAATGEVVWQKNISSYLGAPSFARTSPVIVDKGAAIVIGAPLSGGPPASLVKVDAKTGAMIWITTVDPHPSAIITASPAFVNNTLIVGISSSEEFFAASASYPCCSFRGSLVAIDATTGDILWKTYMTPDTGQGVDGYSGAAIWGSTPAIDVDRGLVYVATGNNYKVPADVAACQMLTPNSPTCADPANRIDSIVALDLATGQIRWTYQAAFSDNSNNGCIFGINCEAPRGPDNDFAQAPLVVDTPVGTAVFAGQKSGVGYAVNADDGKLLWQTQVGSRIMWGSATDGCRIYVADGTDLARTSGAWSALDPSTGTILWTTNAPGNLSDHSNTVGPVSVANGVVFGGSENVNGDTMFGLDAATGQILFSFSSGSSVAGGPAITNGVLYWGSGYSKVTNLTGNNKIFALSPLGK